MTAENAHLFFDRLAERYWNDFEANPLAREQRRRVHALLAPLLKPGYRVLDVGCGTGVDFPLYQQTSVQVTALDVSEAMLAHARRRAIQMNWPVQLMQVDFQQYEPDQRFHGLVFNFGVLNAFAHPGAVLKKAARMVLPSGFALVVVMPPVHLAWLAGHLRRGHWRTVKQRLIKKTLSLPSGLTVRYVDRRDIPGCWRVERVVPLAPLLPPPAYLNSRRPPGVVLKLACAVDRLAAPLLPAALGGDHVAYLLKLIGEPRA